VSFGKIIGHTRQIRILRSALKARRLPHAYLFEGPDGIGKRRVALALAQAIQCTRQDDNACGLCESCRKVEEHTHPDVWWVEPEKNAIRIDVIRQLQRDMNFEPLEGSGRVIIVDEADTMLHNAANAMLKTLEEPPGASTMVLITSRPQQLLPTIVSRCQRLAFGPLTKEMASQVIARQIGDDPGIVALLASLSGGSPGRALAFDRELFLEERPPLIEEVERCSLNNVKEIFKLAEKLDKERKAEISIILEILQCWYRDLAVYQVTGNPEQLINVDLLPIIQKVAGQESLELAISRFEAIGKTLRNLDRNANVRLSLDVLLLGLSAAGRGPSFIQ